MSRQLSAVSPQLTPVGSCQLSAVSFQQTLDLTIQEGVSPLIHCNAQRVVCGTPGRLWRPYGTRWSSFDSLPALPCGAFTLRRFAVRVGRRVAASCSLACISLSSMI